MKTNERTRCPRRRHRRGNKRKMPPTTRSASRKAVKKNDAKARTPNTKQTEEAEVVWDVLHVVHETPGAEVDKSAVTSAKMTLLLLLLYKLEFIPNWNPYIGNTIRDFLIGAIA